MIWKAKAGKQLPLAVARELIKTGYTAAAGDGLPRPQRTQLPRPPGAEPDRGGQMAGGVQRGLGQGGRKAPRGRRRSSRRGEAGAAAAVARPQRRLSQPPASASGRCARMACDAASTLISGPANAGKARVVMDAVRRASGPRRRAAAGRADARRRGALPARAGRDGRRRSGVRVERFAGLVEELVRRAGGRRRRCSARSRASGSWRRSPRARGRIARATPGF